MSNRQTCHELIHATLGRLLLKHVNEFGQLLQSVFSPFNLVHNSHLRHHICNSHIEHYLVSQSLWTSGIHYREVRILDQKVRISAEGHS